MKKTWKKSILAVATLAVLSFCFAGTVNAAVLVKTPEEAKKQYEEYVKYDEEHPDEIVDLAASPRVPILISGKNVSLNDYISLEYEDEKQKELFDYTFENNTLTVKVKDIDVYNAMLERKYITDKNDPVYQKMSKYARVSESGNCYVGLDVKIYFKGDITRIETADISKTGYVAALGEDVDITNVYGTDEKGKYAKLGSYGELGFKTDEDTYGWRMGASGWDKLWSYNWYNRDKTVVRFLTDNETKVHDYEEGYFGYSNTTCSAYAIWNFKLELAETAVADQEKGVSITAKKDMNAKIKVDVLDKASEPYKDLSGKVGDNEILKAFEVSMDGNYTGAIKVTFDVGTEYNGRAATVYHKKANGEIETLNAKVNNGKVTVSVKELSPFMVTVAKAETPTNPTTEEPEETPSKPATTDRKKDNPPKTGTVDTMPIVAGIVGLATIGLAVILKKD